MSGKRTIVYTSVAIIMAFIIGALTSEPIVEAASGWKEAIENLQAQIDAIPETQVYEVSDTVVILQGEKVSTIAELRCLDNDWIDDALRIIANPSIKNEGLRFGITNTEHITDGNLGPNNERGKIIGRDLSVDIINEATAPFDITFTISTLCRIPLP